MKRPAPWQLEKQRTAKAMRLLPKCVTKGCDGKAVGWLSVPQSKLCPMCQFKLRLEQRAQRERTNGT